MKTRYLSFILKNIFSLAFIVLFSNIVAPESYAQVCGGPPSYCIGQVANTIVAGCTRTGPNSCGPVYATTNVGCNGSCSVSPSTYSSFGNCRWAGSGCKFDIVTYSYSNTSCCYTPSGGGGGSGSGGGSCTPGLACAVDSDCCAGEVCNVSGGFGTCGAPPIANFCGCIGCDRGASPYGAGSCIRTYECGVACTPGGDDPPWWCKYPSNAYCPGSGPSCTSDGGVCSNNSDCCTGVCNSFGTCGINFTQVAGFVTNSVTNAPLANIEVILVNPALGSGSPKTTRTDSGGFYLFQDVVENGTSYAVRIQGNRNTPQTAPSGLVPPARTTYVGAYQDSCGSGGPILPGSQSYECMVAASGRDCGTQCHFEYEPYPVPTSLATSAPVCVSNSLGRRQEVTLSWSRITSGPVLPFRYRVVAKHTSLPDSYISLLDDNAANCPGNTCSVTIPAPTSAQLSIGDWDWTVTAQYADGTNTTASPVGSPDFVIATCPSYDISGNVYEVTVQTGLGLCTIDTTNSLIGNIFGAVDYTTAGLNIIYRDDVAGTETTSTVASSGSYTLGALSGNQGRIYFNDISLDPIDTNLANAGVFYELACRQQGSSAPFTFVNPLTDTPIAAFSSDLTNYNFGYRLVNPYDVGWISSVDGDVYGDIITAGIPPTPSGSTFENFLASHSDNYSVAVFGQTLNIGGSDPSNQTAEGNEYLEGIVDGFWPTNFSFAAPANASPIGSGSGEVRFVDLRTSEAYTISGSDMTSILNGRNTYSLSGGPGIATIYVSGNLTLNQELKSTGAQSNVKRILFVVDGEVVIDDAIGVDPTTSPDLSLGGVETHIQAGVISSGNITLVANPSGGDNIIIIEGPFVAGNGSSGAANITSNRNLGIYNALYPAVIVRYNNLYANELTRASGLMEQTVIWQIDP